MPQLVIRPNRHKIMAVMMLKGLTLNQNSLSLSTKGSKYELIVSLGSLGPRIIPTKRNILLFVPQRTW